MPPSLPSGPLLAAIERMRRRVWALCYRMTGSRAEADDLSQEAIARALEREAGLADRRSLEGWLLRIAATVCLDHLRQRTRLRRATDLVDPLDLPDLPPGEPRGSAGRDPEAAAILRDDVRFAVVVALQALGPRQRAALLLHDVCDLPIEAVADSVGSSPNAAKALLHRARVAVARARVHGDTDAVADPAVVERLARAIAAHAVGDVVALLADDVWGVVDGGDAIRVATKPSIGRRAVARRWENAHRRFLDLPITCAVRRLNGEPAVVIVIDALPDTPFATVHVETRRGRIAALRVVRDPRKLAGVTGGVPS